MDTLFGRGRGNQEDAVDAARFEFVVQRGDGFDRGIDGQHAVHARFGSRLGKCLITHFMNRVQITHQDDGRVAVCFAEAAYDVQYVVEGNFACQRTLGSALDGRTVRHRVGKGNAQFQDVGAVFNQTVHQRKRGIEIGIAYGNIGNQGFCAVKRGKGLLDSAHLDFSFP